jgi:hypothetical protein
MKDIKAILKDAGVELTDEQSSGIWSAVAENYKTVAEHDGTRTKLDGANTRIADLEKQLADMQTSLDAGATDKETLASMKKQLDDYKAADGQRKTDEAAAKASSEFTAAMDAAVGDQKFVNDYVKRSIYDEVRKRHGENSALGLKDILDEVTKDTTGIFASPQNDPVKLPIPTGDALNGKADEKADEATIRKVMGLKPKE